MKHFNKIITILMCIILVFAITSCNNQTQEGTQLICNHICDICGNCQDNSSTDSACKEKCTCVRELHDRKISQSSNVLVNKNGVSEYTVIASKTSRDAQTAAGFIANNINSAVGGNSVKAAIYNEEEHVWSADKKYICAQFCTCFLLISKLMQVFVSTITNNIIAAADAYDG